MGSGGLRPPLAGVLVLIAALALADEGTAPGPADPAVFGIDLSPSDYEHWSFRPISRPAVPVPAANTERVANPIDAFVLQKLHEKGMSPSPPADDRTWLRRVTFDLTGVPPTPEQVDAFLNDRAPGARERVVDRLLADPGYGQRWGRRWLDVVRYADTNGYERDGAKPQAWRYRDYVIDSLNKDKPFNVFLTEQLAGDELDGVDAQTMIATTFLRLGTWDDEPADPMVDRYDQLDDILGTVSASFLGLTLRCARCHNHKFEPLSQIDYARMLAIFEPLKRPQKERADLDVPVGTPQELRDHQALVARHESAVKGIEEQTRALDEAVRARYFAAGQTRLAPDAFEAHRLPEDKRNDAQKKLVKETQKAFDEEIDAARTADEKKQRAAFKDALKAIEAAAPTGIARAYIWNEPAGPPPVTQVFRRGNPAAPAGTVAPGFPGVLSKSHVDLIASPSKESTSRRRLSLARWMTDPKNPLVARVIINRLWQGHFGNGLVSSENDFGVMGMNPTNPELLDWLASELREPSVVAASGAGSTGGATPLGPPLQRGGGSAGPWSLKHIHRLIVLSNTYAQSSQFRADAAKVDVENERLWRFPYRRLEAEAVRDAVLAVNGTLNPKMAGPGVYPKIARAVLEGQSRPGDGWGAFDEREAARRSIYIFVKRSLLVPEMELLDFADTTTSCEQRPVSTIPTQALTLLNGEFLNEQARAFAARLVRDAGDDKAAQIERAYRLALARSPTEAEKSAALAFLDRQARQVAEDDRAAGAATPRDPVRTALEALCLVIYNLNEFAYVD